MATVKRASRAPPMPAPMPMPVTTRGGMLLSESWPAAGTSLLMHEDDGRMAVDTTAVTIESTTLVTIVGIIEVLVSEVLSEFDALLGVVGPDCEASIDDADPGGERFVVIDGKPLGEGLEEPGENGDIESEEAVQWSAPMAQQVMVATSYLKPLESSPKLSPLKARW